MLRRALMGVAVIALLVAIGLFATGQASVVAVAIWVAIEAVVLLLALLFERGRYRPNVSNGPWVPTAERFQDPSTGTWILVEFNPRTGDRRYVQDSPLTRDP